MQSVLDILNLCTQYLQKRGIAGARRQAEELLCDALQTNRLKLYLDFERPVTQAELDKCRTYLNRRAQGEPLAYIHGFVEFYGCHLKVTPAVLIPRQETEILADKIVKQLMKEPVEGKVLWDICCGSGCLGIAIKKQLPGLTVVLTDLSLEAVEIAKENAKANQVDVEVLQGDLLVPFKGHKAHYVVCNPPYIAESEYEKLDPEVRRYEPKLALVGGVKGTEVYEQLAQELPHYLTPSAKIWFEIGYQQGDKIKNLFKGPNWKSQQVENDWAGHSRFFFLESE